MECNYTWFIKMASSRHAATSQCKVWANWILIHSSIVRRWRNLVMVRVRELGCKQLEAGCRTVIKLQLECEWLWREEEMRQDEARSPHPGPVCVTPLSMWCGASSALPLDTSHLHDTLTWDHDNPDQEITDPNMTANMTSTHGAMWTGWDVLGQ